jgi:putative flippase GtrA
MVSPALLRFSMVGLLGIGAQLLAMEMFAGGLRLPTLVASPLAVEFAVLHNFLWHWRWSFAGAESGLRFWPAMLRFHLTNGVISLLGTTAMMWLLHEQLRMPRMPANLVSILACWGLNWTAARYFVFRQVR